MMESRVEYNPELDIVLIALVTHKKYDEAREYLKERGVDDPDYFIRLIEERLRNVPRRKSSGKRRGGLSTKILRRVERSERKWNKIISGVTEARYDNKFGLEELPKVLYLSPISIIFIALLKHFPLDKIREILYNLVFKLRLENSELCRGMFIPTIKQRSSLEVLKQLLPHLRDVINEIDNNANFNEIERSIMKIHTHSLIRVKS